MEDAQKGIFRQGEFNKHSYKNGCMPAKAGNVVGLTYIMLHDKDKR